MTDEEEVSETRFTLIEELHRTSIPFLPQSPRKLAIQSAEMGWDVNAWASFGEYMPTLYVSGSDEGDENQHLPGDVKFDGYIAKHFIIEARDPETRAIGFRAHYAGRIYEDARKAPLGSFDFALVADPVGLPTPLHATYKLRPASRGDAETDKSFARRAALIQEQIKSMDRYNDGEFYWPTTKVISAAKEFDAWLAEWRSFL